MNTTIEGWYNENKEEIRQDDIWKKDYVTFTQRLHGYFIGFEPVSGTDEEELDYYYDAVKIFIYLDENGKELCPKAFVPWYDGEEIRNVEIPSWLQEKILNSIKEHPVPTLIN